MINWDVQTPDTDLTDETLRSVIYVSDSILKLVARLNRVRIGTLYCRTLFLVTDEQNLTDLVDDAAGPQGGQSS